MSDRAVQQSIEARFLDDPHLSAYALCVEVEAGVATLAGTVPDARAKLAAQELAQSAQGCRGVHNQIVIERAEGISDAEITDEVRALLDNHPAIVKGSIAVQVQAGRVVLSGAVAMPREYELAQDVAKSARGVRGIKNRLLIDRIAQDDDESLQREIESALAAVPELTTDDLKVAVGGDVVVLSGQVRDLRHKQLAEEIVRGLRPWRVRNEVDVLAPGRPSEDESD